MSWHVTVLVAQQAELLLIESRGVCVCVLVRKGGDYASQLRESW